jgi:EAL domain-containing protein (putative c-di-GMP-specific phosphodiesterase class I)
MVQAMGGAFAAPSRRDRGATFAFRLPSGAQDKGQDRAQAPETPSCWTAAASTNTPDGRPDGSGSVARVLIAVRGACTRRALSRYLARAGLAVSLYDGTDPAADVRLVIADPPGLKALGPVDIPIIRLVAPNEVMMQPSPTPLGPSAILSQPLCRAELEILLQSFIGGQPGSAPAAGGASLDRAGWRTVPLIVAGASALTDDERALLADLDGAAERGEFSLAYQPQVDRESERIVGVEALLRWDHPTRGSVDPSDFIPLAERNGQIGKVTTWVIDRVLAETQYLTGLQVSFNASALEFAQTDFVDRLLAAVDETGYDARRLEVEITETAILYHETPVRESMDRLHAAGIGVTLDDFGAGYSSLSHLRRYPLDKLKIDRAFIIDCSRNMESATIVVAVVSIGRALGMKVIAEGVETTSQRDFLRIAGVCAMQGFLFGKPVPIDDLAPLLNASRAPELV